MKKGEWYRILFGRIDQAIANDYYFEASFICYGIIEDRLDSILRLLSLPATKGVEKKIKKIVQVRSAHLESVFEVLNWDGGKYRSRGLLGNVGAWGILYRNPMQHLLGDPREYKATIGDFHTAHSRDLAVEGRNVARELSSAVMRLKKRI